MLDNKNNEIVYPMDRFPIRYAKEKEYFKLVELFHEHNFEVSPYMDLKCHQTHPYISFQDDEIAIIPIHVSYAFPDDKDGKQVIIYVCDLLKHFDRVFIKKDQAFFNKHIVHHHINMAEAYITFKQKIRRKLKRVRQQK